MENDRAISEDKAAYWQRQIQEWKSSSLTQTAFCEQHNLSTATFGYWRKKLSGTKKAKANTKLASLNVTPSTSALRLRTVNGVIIEIPLNLPTQQLKLLFNLLGISTC